MIAPLPGEHNERSARLQAAERSGALGAPQKGLAGMCDPQRIEECALNAWPALHTALYDGWVLRLANGFSKRANSATPVYPARTPLDDQIAWIAAFYHRRQQVPLFRLPSFLPVAELDARLDSLGYTRHDETGVQALTLSGRVGAASRRMTVLNQTTDWLHIHHALNGARGDLRTHGQLLAAVLPPRGLMILTVDGEIVACGLVVVEGALAGLFDIVTHPDHRRKGYATELVQSMLAWSRKQGARHAYLQVLQSNTAALALYAKLGFQEVSRYWYRSAPLLS